LVNDEAVAIAETIGGKKFGAAAVGTHGKAFELKREFQ
jgi:hypothetical protein